jgi:hypothetical protein
MVVCLLQQKHRVYEFYKLCIYNMDHARQTLSLLIVTLKYHIARRPSITFLTVVERI